MTGNICPDNFSNLPKPTLESKHVLMGKISLNRPFIYFKLSHDHPNNAKHPH